MIGTWRDDRYLLDNRQAEAGRRFDAIGTIFDPVTFGHIRALGIAWGWRCWEVGAGGATVPTWLGERVGAGGRVLATDIDTSWTLPAAGGAVEVRRHDVARDPAPDEVFDLVHARLVLVHLVDRAAALRAMIGALRPGGWLLIEDADPALQPLACPDEFGPAEALANRIRHGFRQMLAQRGAELAYGRTLPRLLREEGLIDVEADGFFPMTSTASNLLEAATVEQLREGLIAQGHAGAAEIDEHLANIAAGRLDLTTAPMISAWGRRPEDASHQRG
jgi:SAM-dependent methyltransferase